MFLRSRPQVRPMLAGVAMAITLASSGGARADGSPINSSAYYEMNGGEVVSSALNLQAQGPAINLEAAFKLPTACEIWENRNDLSAYGERLIRGYIQEQLVGGLTDRIIIAVESLPEMITVAVLQRALPGMYDWMTNIKGQVDTRVNVTKQSCQQAVSAMDGGSSPLDAWIKVSTSQRWRETLAEDYDWNSDTGHLFATSQAMPDRARAEPIAWFGGAKGASDAAPIKLVEDIVSAGYAALSSKTYTGTAVTPPPTSIRARLGVTVAPGDPTPTVKTRISTLWPTSAEVVTFATRMLGEETIAYCEDCNASVTPGVGLKPALADEEKKLTEAWNTLITAYPWGGTKRPKIFDFNKVSSQSTRITKAVYEALNDMLPQDRGIFIYRLIADVALENTVEKGLAIRRMVRSGMMTPQTQAYPHIAEKGRTLVEEARQEVEDLTWEVGMQRDLASKTASTLLSSSAIESLTRAGSTQLPASSATTNRTRSGDFLQD